MRHRNYESASKILEHACQGTRPQKKNKGQEETTQKKATSLHANLRVWSFYVDLLENLGHNEQTKKAYERMMDLKIATPQTILNFTSFLQRTQQFEHSFRIFERALAPPMFDAWPYAHEIWLTYLKSIIQRYADSKVERIRDLFNQVLGKVPPKQAKVFFYMYADYEENFGLLTHAMEIYDRAAKEMSEAGH